MEIKDEVIIDGNAVYEIDDNCKNKMQTTDIRNNNETLFQLMILLSLIM